MTKRRPVSGDAIDSATGLNGCLSAEVGKSLTVTTGRSRFEANGRKRKACQPRPPILMIFCYD